MTNEGLNGKDGKDGPTATTMPSLKSMIGLAVALILGAYLALTMSSSGSLLERGTPAPAFELRSVGSNDQISLASLRGKVVLIDFWATTCPPCLRQMRDLEVIQHQMSGQDVVILGINTEGAPQQVVQQFVRERGVRYPVLIDTGMVAEHYRVDRLPTLYIIDKDGRVRWSGIGFTPHEELAQIIREFI